MAFTILNIVGLFRTILIVALIYLIIKWISKLLMPPQNKKTHQQKNTSDKDGSTTIKYNRKGEKLIERDKGEYVDFEEVD